ncbi:hypothetical protein DFH28DRAFT_264852 [Melampsora americana]|nr:hypothetical protein DFH28DRAFT_264852 [Melampsora americana]
MCVWSKCAWLSSPRKLSHEQWFGGRVRSRGLKSDSFTRLLLGLGLSRRSLGIWSTQRIFRKFKFKFKFNFKSRIRMNPTSTQESSTSQSQSFKSSPDVCRFITNPPIPQLKASLSIDNTWSIAILIKKIQSIIISETSDLEFTSSISSPSPTHRLILEQDGTRLPSEESCSIVDRGDVICVRLLHCPNLNQSPLPSTSLSTFTPTSASRTTQEKTLIPKIEDTSDVPFARSHIEAFRKVAVRHYRDSSDSSSNSPERSDTYKDDEDDYIPKKTRHNRPPKRSAKKKCLRSATKKVDKGKQRAISYSTTPVVSTSYSKSNTERKERGSSAFVCVEIPYVVTP